MTYATVMVSLALDESNEARLEAAGQIAERFDSGIVGIAAAQFSPPVYFTSGEQAQNLIDQGQASIKKRMSELEVQFREATKNRAKYVEWRCAIDFPARYILQEARCADIIVSGGQSNALSDPFALASPKDLARRAIAYSLPMLRKAKEVTVAEIVEAGDNRSAAVSRVRDVVAWLSRHGVSASEVVPEDGGDVIAQLDAIAANVGAGVVVAGAYGHSRFRELILGGMTQHLMTQSSRCVLLSH